MTNQIIQNNIKVDEAAEMFAQIILSDVIKKSLTIEELINKQPNEINKKDTSTRYE